MHGSRRLAARPPDPLPLPAARRRTILAAIALPALLAAGCGGSDEGKPAAPAGPGTPAARTPGFEEVSKAAGLAFFNAFLPGEQGERFKINLYDHGSGMNVVDYDGDGKDDLYFVNQLGPNGLFRNNGNGTFTDVSEASGLAIGDRICISAAFADYDNDGDQDVYIGSPRGGNLLFRNDGKGRFEDVTDAAGLRLVAHTQGVTWFDYDGDGKLDIYVTNTAKWTMDLRDSGGRYWVGVEDLLTLVQSEPEYNVLYRNNGDGTFTDVTAKVGVAGKGWGGDVATFDMDEDGDQDLFVTNMFGISIYYRNNGDGTFTDVTDAAMGYTSWGAVGCKQIDYDGNGLLDLLVIDMHSDMWMNFGMTPGDMEETRKFAGPEGPMVERGLMSAADAKYYRDLVFLDPSRISKVVFGTTLYRNAGKGKFEEVSAKAKVESLWPWGIAAADYDLDGWEDLFIPSAMGYPYFPWPNALFMNQRDGTYAKRSKEEGLDPRPGGPYLPNSIGGHPAAKSSRSAAFLDYDEDGRPDIVVNNFNEGPFLYRNRFPMRHWLKLRLRGTHCNRDAFGAVVRVEAGGRTQVRELCAAGGYLSQDTKTVHFGLGDAARIDRCTVTWPDGTLQEVPDVKADRVNEVVEAPKGPR